ncbi:discoidin domain-containing protein [Streptomyces sp. NPDC005808]|uniref:discoidin domain-containing protein n=1 Tax=Streptomyces sp. NPDC005808 TaxID=3364734 RepID=UPI0036A80987
MSIKGTRLHLLPSRRGRRRTGVGLLAAISAVATFALAGAPAAQGASPQAASAQPPAKAVAAQPAAAVAPAAVPAAPAGFTTTWSDDFSGAANTGLNTDIWRYDVGEGWTFGTGEVETMTNSTANVYHDGNGHLVIKALHSGTDPVLGWTSGRVETQADGFGALPGGVVRMESSLQQPNVNTTNGLGYWPAFWMLGSPLRVGTVWPGSGEIDIMEDINGRSSVFGALHCGTNPGGPCNESTGVGSGERACSGCQTGYHTYAVEIDRSTSPEQIRWYLDGVNFYTLSSNQIDATAWSNAVDHSFFIIFNLAIGGGFPAAYGGGPTAATVSGGSLNIDYVAVYNKAPPGATGTNIAQGKPTTASSAESASFPAANATDGNISTRWSSAFSDPQWLQVDLGATYNLTHASVIWEAAAASAYQLQTSTNGTTWTTIYSNNNSPQLLQDTALSGSGRYVRIYATARNSTYGASLYELRLYGSTSGSTPGTLLSQGRTATTSSSESTSFTAPMAVDGNTGTRWSSTFTDPQWLQVDLGATHAISSVALNWEGAYGTAYQIQTSANGTTWTTIYSTTASTGGNQTLTVTGSGRYVRMYGTARSTQYGYSLWEFQVYGT